MKRQRHGHGYLVPGSKVKINSKVYVAFPNLPQILNQETNCYGCAFCKGNGVCDLSLLNRQKNFHCGSVEDPVENQILLKLLE